LEDFIFVTNQLPKSQSLLEAFTKVASPCFFTSLTTILAFSTLGLSDLDTIKYFGLWAAFGACVEWISTFILIPSIIKVFPQFNSWNLNHSKKSQSFFSNLLAKSPPKIISYACLLLFISAYVSIKNFKLSQTPTEMFPKDHPFQETIDYLKADRGWVAQASLVYAANLSQIQKTRIRERIKDQAILYKLESWDSVIDYIKPADSDPLMSDMIAREVSISELSDRYHSSMGEQKDILYLRSTTTTDVNLLRSYMEKVCPQRECWLAGEFIGFADFSKGLIDTLFESLFMSLLLVGGVIIFLALSYGNSRELIGLLVSSFWGPAVMLTAIYACGISINFVTCVVAATLIGLTGDNAIMFIFQKEKNLISGIQSMGLGSIQTALIMSLCSLTFIFSYFEPPQMLGILLAGGFISAVVGDIWLLKGLIPQSSSVTDSSHST
ncbi:MAG: hypothetical protein K2P81_08265, partial [Bacteriovoracaceae bacterium]|nr:hypothetical protein [Bacteriovoracaceae bacterium]